MIARIFTTQEYKIKGLISGSSVTDIEGNWALISIYHDPLRPVITSDLDTKILRQKGCKKVLSVCFWDYTDKELETFSDKYKTAHKHINIITHTQACTIVRFLRHLRKYDNIKTLVVQCKMGVSRSGAIGLYATRLYNLNENEYMDSGIIKPNYFVYKMLCEVFNPMKLLQKEST
jgi:hypothetical protein